MFEGLLVENTKIVSMAIGLVNAGAFVGDYVSMKNAKKLAIIIGIAPASGTDAAAITLLQAKTVGNSPASEKALAFTRIWKNADVSLTDTLVETTVTNNTINSSAAAKSEMWVAEIDAEDLDMDNDFDCVRLNVADPGSVSTPAYAVGILYQLRYKGATPPSSILD